MKYKISCLMFFIVLLTMFCPIIVKADVTNYNIWVGNTQVTSENKDNIDGNNRVSYDVDNNVLTLNNFNYAGESDGYVFEEDEKTYHAAIYSSGALNINMTGNSALIPSLPNTGGNYGIYVGGDLNITGSSDKTLTIGVSESAEENYGMFVSGNLTVTNAKLSINSSNSTNSNSYGIVASNNITFNNTTSEISGYKSFTKDSIGIYTETGSITVNNSTINATGGIAAGLTDSKSYGIKTFGDLNINGDSSVKAKGGTASNGNDASVNNNSYGSYIVGDVNLKNSSLFESFAGSSAKGTSYGLYTESKLNMYDEGEYHSSGFTKAMNVLPTYNEYSAYVITFSDVYQQNQENRGGNSLDPSAFNTAKYVKIKPAALVNFSTDAIIKWKYLTNDEIRYGIEYDGTVKTPEVEVMYEGEDLVENIDYTLHYDEGRKSVGEYKVYATGIGNYSGEASREFTIKPVEVDSITFDTDTLPYTGENQKPNETVQAKGITLTSDDYEIIYYRGSVMIEENQIDFSRIRDIGAYTLLIKAKGNFTGEIYKVFNIEKAYITNENSTLSFDETSFEYTGNRIRPVVTVTRNGYTLNEGVDYEVTFPEESIDIGSYSVTITGINNYEGTLTKSYSIGKANIGELILSNEEYTYNGEVQVPTVTVEKGNKVLTKDVDYELEYSNDASINHGTYTITATGINNYAGTLEKTYVIKKAPITELILDQEEYVYNEGVQTPEVTVKSDGKILTENEDYEVTLPDGRTNVGTYTISVVGINNYEGTLEKTYEIHAKAITDVDFDQEEYTYDGEVHTPHVTVYYGSNTEKTLIEGTDYELTLPEGMTDAGRYEIVITGINNYSGVIEKEFVINPKALTEATLDQYNFPYTGESHVPVETVKSDNVTVTRDSYDIHYETTTLKVRVEPENMIAAGTYFAVIEGKGNYSGYFSIPFYIDPINIEGNELFEASLSEDHYYYTGEEVHPTLTVKYNNIPLVLNEDYEVVYPAETTELNTYEVIVRGINNYTGQIELPFVVERMPLTEDDISFDPVNYTYTGSLIKPKVVVKKNNRILEEGEDYEVDYPTDSIEMGEYSVTVRGINHYTGEVTKKFKINSAYITSVDLSKTNYTYNGKIQVPTVTVKFKNNVLKEGTDYTVKYSNNRSTNAGEYTVTVTGKGSYKGYINKTYVINPKAITSVDLSQSVFTYNGKEKLPDVRVKSGSTTLSSYNYKVTFSKGRINIGTYTVTITGRHNYKGTIKKTYIIRPRKVEITDIQRKSKKIKVIWKKGKKALTDGYQIRYSKKSNFKTYETRNVKGQARYKKTIAKLKKNKRYYVQIRTYKIVDGKKYYSGWSKTKSKRTK